MIFNMETFHGRFLGLLQIHLSYLIGLNFYQVFPLSAQPHIDHQKQVLKLPQIPVSDIFYIAIVLFLDGL